MTVVRGVYTGLPSFLPEWRERLTKSQKWKLLAFFLIYLIFYLSMCYLMTYGDFFKTVFKLKYVNGENNTAKEIKYDLVISKTFGFHDDTEAPAKIVLSEQPHSKGHESMSEHHSWATDVQFQRFVGQQVNEVQRQWAECYKRSHRGRIFRTVAVIILTLGLVTLRIALVVSLINRISMIHWVLRGVDLMLIAICLKYIALVDYSLCLCRMNNRPESRMKLKSVFEIELHHTTKRTVMYVWTLLFLGGPLYVIGIDLALFDSNLL